jgi:Family of unknown function (DUF6441)
MKLAAVFTRSLQAGMQAELRDIERAAAAGTHDAGRGPRQSCGVRSRAPAQRLANSWRDKHYLDAASLVYTKAPPIIRAFDEGGVIRSKRGRFLAIPTEDAPRGSYQAHPQILAQACPEVGGKCDGRMTIAVSHGEPGSAEVERRTQQSVRRG